MTEAPENTPGENRILIRQLRETVHELADAVDELESQGNSPRSDNASQKAQNARDVAGPIIPEDEKIHPPEDN